MKKLLFLSLLTSSMFGMELDRVSFADNPNKFYVDPFSVKVPERLGSLDLYHGNKGFYVRQDDKKFEIKKYFTDPLVRNMTKTQLKAFLTAGYLSINQFDDGEYSIRAKMRLNGGGPILGTIAYWVTKSLCYGTAVAAVGTVVVATGGVAGAVSGAAVAGTTLGASAGATIVGGAITGAGLGTQAALVTGAAVTSVGSVAGTIAAVETTSLAVGAFFGMLPTP